MIASLRSGYRATRLPKIYQERGLAAAAPSRKAEDLHNPRGELIPHSFLATRSG